MFALWICLWTFIAPGLIAALGGRKKWGEKASCDFKPKRILLIFLDATGRGEGAGLCFSPFLCFASMETKSGLQYSQLSSLQPRSSMSCWAPTLYLHQAGAFYPPVVPVSMQCHSLFFASPRGPEPAAGWMLPFSLWASGANSCWVNSTSQPRCMRVP